MSEGLDIQIRVMTQNAKREVQQFVQNARRELQQGLRTNMGGGSGGNAAKDPFTAGMRAGTQKMKDEQREREGILKKAAADQQRIAEQSAKRSLARQRKAALDQQKIDEQTAKRSLARQRKAALEQQKIAERSAKRSLAQQKRDSVAANSAAEQQAKIEESAANRAVIAWRVASAEIQKLRNRAVATAATPTRTSGHGRQDAIANREKSVLLAMAANSDTPIQSVIAQQKKVDSLIQSGAARRLRFIREREESAVQLRKRSQKDAEHAANQQAKAEEKAAQRAAAAWRAANKQVAALDQERRAAIGRATKAQGRGGRAGAVVDREAATLIGMASDRSVPIEKVRAQEAKLTAMVAASERKRLSIVRQSEEQAVRARKAGAEAVYNVERIKNAKLRSAARNVQAEMLAAARSGDASQIARAERLGQSLVTIKRRNSRDIINTIIQQEAAAGKISTKRAAEMMATQNHMAKGAGRNAIYLFQFQQAIEDSAAALSTGQGFTGVIRSAGNNLALMASLLGGTTGTVALVGLMAIGVGSLTHSLYKLTSASKKQNEEAERQNELLREELQLRLQLAGEISKIAATMPGGMQDATQEELEHLKQVREAIQDIIRGGGGGGLVDDVASAIVKDARAALEDLKAPVSDLLDAADGGDRLQAMQQEIQLRKDAISDERQRVLVAQNHLAVRLKIRELTQPIVGFAGAESPVLGPAEMEQLKAWQEQLQRDREWFEKHDKAMFAGLFPGGEFNINSANKQIDDLKKGIAEAVTETDKMGLAIEQMLHALIENKDLKAQALIADAKSNDISATILASILQQNEAVKAQLAFRERLRGLVTAEEEANRRMMTEAEQQKADAKAELERADKHLAKERERLAAIQDEAQREKELAKAEEERDKAAEKYKQTMEAITQLEEERKRIQQELIQGKRDELREGERNLEQGRQEIEQIKEKIAQLAKARQSSRDAFETSAFDVVRNRTQDMTKNQAEVAKSQLSPYLPPQVRDFYGQVIDQQFAQLAKARDDALLEMRGKFLSDQAAKAGQSGDFDRQRDLLQELQGLQMGVAGNDPNLARARAAFEAAKETQKAIEATFQKESEAENERMRQLLESNQKLVNALDRLREAIINMERAARGLPPKPEHPDDLPPKEPVEAPRPPKPVPPPKPPVAEPPPKPPVEAPKPPMGQQGAGMPKPPVEAPRPKFDPMNPDGVAFAGLPLDQQRGIYWAAQDHAAKRGEGDASDFTRQFLNDMPADARRRLIESIDGNGEWGIRHKAEDGGKLTPGERDRLAEMKRLAAEAKKDPALGHAVNDGIDKRRKKWREDDRQKMRDELEEGKRKAEEQRKAAQERNRRAEEEARRTQEQARERLEEQKRESARKKAGRSEPWKVGEPKETWRDGELQDISDAGEDFKKSIEDAVANMKGESPLLPKDEEVGTGAAERDPAISSIEDNTRQTKSEVSTHSAKTDTTNAILRELVAVQRQIAATPPTIIVAGGGGGGFPMPSFPGGFPGGGGGFGGPIREEPFGGGGGFGGALASVASSNTFGTVNINVNSMGQAQGLFRDFTLASNASSLRAGR